MFNWIIQTTNDTLKIQTVRRSVKIEVHNKTIFCFY